MAYDKIIPIKGRLDHCVNYVLNPQKADLGRVLDYIGNTDKTITPDGSAILETAIPQLKLLPGDILGSDDTYLYTPTEFERYSFER